MCAVFLRDTSFDFLKKSAFVLITSGGSPVNTLWHLAQAVLKTRTSVIGGIQLRGAVTVPTKFGNFLGRPDHIDLEDAKLFGSAIAAKVINGGALPARYKIDPKSGGRFYDIIGPILTHLKKAITPLPQSDSEKCDLCDYCVYQCPTDRITIENRNIKFHDTCMVCYRCWHVCPQYAISIKFFPRSGFIERTLYSPKMEKCFGKMEKGEYKNLGPNLYKNVLGRKIKLTYDRHNPTAKFEKNE
ncbi:hypothetical protein [Desulfosarcina sp.]|uniref:hypothetical protein n=1 Tax=Desulfosarcina sp. TaxID=2027861 RepID=UPI0035649EF4